MKGWQAMASNELVQFLEKIDDAQIIKFANRAKLKEALNVNPPKHWVKINEYANNTSYLPIDKVETLLDAIFQEWQVEIKQVSQLAQSIVAVVRLHYRDPLSSEWRYHDGVGAVPLKTAKGADASDLSKILSNAVQTGAPAAVSYAIKDAAEHLGSLFGKNLNREDTSENMDIYTKAAENRAAKEINHKQMVAAKIIENEKKIDLIEAIDEANKMTVAELDAFLSEHAEEDQDE